MNSEFIQNICIICLEPDNLKVYNEKFACDCPCFFHDDCWKLFAVDDYKCPLCRKPNIENRVRQDISRSKHFFACAELIIFNVFLLLLIKVYSDLMFVLFFMVCSLSCIISAVHMVYKQSRKYIYIYIFINLFFSVFSLITIQTGIFQSDIIILSFQIIRIFLGLILALSRPYLLT